MRIVADENIPFLSEAFGPLGDVAALPADRMTPEAVQSADALIVRSVTPVGARLLSGSKVRFVATATIGTDHIDGEYLAAHGIGFASAAGSNARSVAEYVVAALTVLAERRSSSLAGKVMGIVGVGNVGSRVARMAAAIGMTVLRNDPPLARSTGDPAYVPIEALFDADFLTFHVPLTHDGPDATYHMIDEGLLRGLKRGATLFNTSRGAVGDTAALRAAIQAGHIGAAVLDVWEGEPNINLDLVAGAAIATPHIAGYSLDGKVNGTRMVLEALCRHFGMERAWDPSPLLDPPRVPRLRIRAGTPPEEALRQAAGAAYDIRADDAALRAMAKQPPEKRSRYFVSLRKNYPVRREFPSTAVELDAGDAKTASLLGALGFSVATPV